MSMGLVSYVNRIIDDLTECVYVLHAFLAFLLLGRFKMLFQKTEKRNTHLIFTFAHKS